MTYSLEFKKSALKEWKKLAPSIQQIFKKKLVERLANPHVSSATVSGGKICTRLDCVNSATA